MEVGNANCKGAIAIKGEAQLIVLPQGHSLSLSPQDVAFLWVFLVAQRFFCSDFSGFFSQHLREHAATDVAENSDISKAKIPIKMCKRMKNYELLFRRKDRTKMLYCQATEML